LTHIDLATHIQLYDTTLRDGSQSEGISFSADDKLKIARRLDRFGVDYIEAGWPGSNPKDAVVFQRMRQETFLNAKIAAFGMTLKKGFLPDNDPNLVALLEAETPVVAIVGKSWDLHVEQILETNLTDNLDMISASLKLMKDHHKEVIFDAEHFFDGYKANPAYAIETINIAETSGADTIVLCDTNGGALPWEIEEIVNAVRCQTTTKLGIHCHNDSGCGVANTLAAVRAGVGQIQGTINGYGERVGNADLCAIIPDLQLKMGKVCVPEANLANLAELSNFVAEIANLPQDKHQPYVGSSAFTHKGGIHVAAMLKNERAYQHIDPQLVGNRRRSVVSELSGRGNLVERSHDLGLHIDPEQAQQLLNSIKDLEFQGFTFEGADASVRVMLQRLQSDYTPPFELIDFTVVVEHRQGRGILAEATVKVRIGERVVHTAAEGNGPVSALDAALRKALVDVYPYLKFTRLDDYKVRILDSENGTGAGVRVLIDTKNGTHRWSTVGASTNIIEASWRAMADSFEYALLEIEEPAGEER
jgi:2-isopropylmalate synthase